MAVEIARRTASHDYHANAMIPCERLKRPREGVPHFGIEIQALGTAQGHNSDPVNDLSIENLGVHLDLPNLIRAGLLREFMARMGRRPGISKGVQHLRPSLFELCVDLKPAL